MKVQGRIKNGILHIQGEGPTVNREYGVAVDIKVSNPMMKAIDNFKHTIPSLAGTDAVYTPIEAKLINDKLIRLTLEQSGEEFNIYITPEKEGFNELAEFIRRADM